MNPRHVALWRRINAQANAQQPAMAKAIARALELIGDQLTDAELEEMARTGNVESVLARVLTPEVWARATADVNTQIQDTARSGLDYFARDIVGLTHAARATIAFNVLSSHVVAAIQKLDDKIVQGLREGIKETIRSVIEAGLRKGANPVVTARELRASIGLTARSAEWVRNFRAAAEAAHVNAKALGTDKTDGYLLRDRRYDKMLARARSTGVPLTTGQIDKMAAAYTRKAIAFDSNTVARTATLDAFRQGQRLSWEDAIAKGYVDRERLMKQWVTVMDGRERELHHEANDEIVAFDDPFPTTGEVIPGSSTYNCRCQSRYFLAKTA